MPLMVTCAGALHMGAVSSSHRGVEVRGGHRNRGGALVWPGRAGARPEVVAGSPPSRKNLLCGRGAVMDRPCRSCGGGRRSTPTGMGCDLSADRVRAVVITGRCRTPKPRPREGT